MLKAKHAFAKFCTVIVMTSIVGCGSDGPFHRDLRVYINPYEQVDWDADLRLKAQHHDHVHNREMRLRAYDAAGYDAVSLMDYSGNRDLSYALTSRMWPPENWLSTALLQDLRSIKFFIPNAEEVGADFHVTSPFLTTYIESAVGNVTKQPWQYSSSAELFTLIRDYGGLPCRAHPWAPNLDFREHSGAFCVEIYSAYASAQRHQGVADYTTVDRNQILVENWDRGLIANQRILGIAVNDHYGPYASASAELPAAIVDSGKIIVFAKAPTLEAYKEAFIRGAFLAVRDLGFPKDQYPTVERILVENDSIRIVTDGQVRWISHGDQILTGPVLKYDEIPANSTYVRAEIRGDGDTVLYTQAFWIRPVGDVDGDYRINDADTAICARVQNGTETDPVYVAACAARSRSAS